MGGLYRLLMFVKCKRTRWAAGDQMRAAGVDADPNRHLPMDQIDHSAFAGHAITALVEVGAVPYRERYQVRHPRG